MKRFLRSTRGLAAGLLLAGGASEQAAAQFAPVPAYQNYPATAAAPAYAAAPQRAYQAPPPAARLAPPTYGYQRVAQAGELPAPTEAINGARAAAAMSAPAMSAPAPAVTPAPMAAYSQPAPAAPMMSHSGYQPSMAQQTSYPTATHVGHHVGQSGCATGNCGAPTATYSAPVAHYPAPATESCGYGGGSCDVGYQSAPAYACAAPAAPRRQWFAGVYGLFLNRAGDQSKTAVAYMTDSAAFGGGPDNYYPTAADPCLHTADAGYDAQWGAEIRFGSTFGHDPCNCNQPFAWEVGYWGLNTDSSAATLLFPGTVGFANDNRLYTLYDYNGVEMDLDGPGTTWDYRRIYDDNGMPADSNLDANDVRVVGVRVRQRFSAQNLELNFWRFGTPTAAGGGCGGLGGFAGGGAACGGGSCGTGSCGVDACGGCAPAACAPSRPPRRFFINGLAGVRYLRVDDDFGFDQQFTLVGTDPAVPAEYREPRAGWPTGYEGFPADDNSVLFSDFEANNELIGFQLGCSMNWLVGCRWNLFADTNFGIYGNSADVNKRIIGGGDSVARFINGGGLTNVRGSETSVAYVGELRAGVGYQVSCNCRLTAAYRFIGIGGLALGADEFVTTNWSTAEAASHINTNHSLILHGLQTGVEFTY